MPSSVCSSKREEVYKFPCAGVSKTWVLINYAAARFLKGKIKRVLVVTVTSGLGVIEDEVALHCPVPWRVVSHEGVLLSQSQWYTGKPHEDKLEFMVVNYQNVYARLRLEGRDWAPMPNTVLEKFVKGKPCLVAVDESHHIGSPTAEQSKHIRLLGRFAHDKLIMTGSMFHRKPFFVFGQALFYDDGRRLGSNWGEFKKRVAVMGGFGGYTVQRYKNLKWMMRQMEDFVYMEDYVPPRDVAVNPIHFDLSGRGLDSYVEMATEKVLEVEGETLISENVLTYHLRLCQLAGGFVRLPESGRYVQVGSDMVNILEDRLHEYMEQDIHKAVIGCRFIPELRAAAVVAKKLGFEPILFHGAVPKGAERRNRIARFKRINKPALFISQISAGKESIDLSVASTMLFTSLSESYVEHDQFTKRIEKYKEKRVLQYDFLIGRGTRSQVSYDSLKLKQDVARFIRKNPDYVERITAQAVKAR